MYVYAHTHTHTRRVHIRKHILRKLEDIILGVTSDPTPNLFNFTLIPSQICYILPLHSQNEVGQWDVGGKYSIF